MRYAATPSSAAALELMASGVLDGIITPAQRINIPAGHLIADNGCFGKGYPGDTAWHTWLARQPTDRVRFAVAPDVVGDAAATLARSAPHLPAIRKLGHRAALVAQDGLEHLPVPWDDFDALFLGGTTAWKLSPAARHLTHQATARGKWVHMGRVNSERRYRYAAAIGCDSADGTILAFGPDTNLPHILAWLRGNAQLALLEHP